MSDRVNKAGRKTARLIASGGALLLCISILIMTTLAPTHGCTIWAATGDCTVDRATLVTKNRDWEPNHYNELWFIVPQQGFRFLGIYALGGNSQGVKAGINEKGLCVVYAATSTLNREKIYTGETGLTEKALRSCDSVDAVLGMRNVFSKSRPSFLLFADNRKIMLVEIGLEGQYFACMTDNGTLFHTNHYLHEEFTFLNTIANESSLIRLSRLRELLESYGKPFTIDSFVNFSLDQHDGPDNSIFRTGSTATHARQLSSWSVVIPRDGNPPELRVILRNPEESARKYWLFLDGAFWKRGVLDLREKQERNLRKTSLCTE